MRLLRTYAIPVLFCLGGLVLAHHEFLLHGFGFIQFDPGDTRFVNYLLEHGYRWGFGWNGHDNLWSPPFFYPAADTLAYSENMLGTMPVYALFRVAGFPYDTAFQLWILSLGALNFAAMYLLLRRCFTFGQLASAVGAALFAYAGIRINQTMHYQVFPTFFSVWAVHAAYRLLSVDRDRLTEKQRVWWIAALCFGVVGQIWASIYMGWYLVFGMSVAFALALLFRTPRTRLLRLVAAHPYTLVLAGLASAAVLLPLALRYSAVSKQFGTRPFEECLTMIPVAKAWFHMGPYHWLYSGLSKTAAFQGIPMEHEQRCGFGFATTALFLGGFWLSRRRSDVRFAGMVLAVVLLTATLYGGWGGFTPWKLVYDYFPGAQAIRAVSRLGITLLIPVGIGAAALVHHLAIKGGKWLVLASVLGVGMLVEQGETTPAFDKAQAREDIAAIASAIKPECEAFLFSPVQGYGPYWKYQLDAMMASLEANVPTLNGYSGHNPEAWPFGDTNVHTEQDQARVQQMLNHWVGLKKLDPSKVCWAAVQLQEGPYRSVFVSQSLPTTMVAGQRYPVTVKVRNTGADPWTSELAFRLGSQSPRDNETWGKNRVELAAPVPPGGEAAFTFEVTAPPSPGRYPFQWRMVRDMVMWFGAGTPMVEVEVAAPGTSMSGGN